MRPTAVSVIFAIVALFGASIGNALLAAEKPVSGTVTIEQYQVAWIISGNLGGGKLSFDGKIYDFQVGGLGIGGFGASKIEATGNVYGLTKVADFSGAYGQARYGVAAADKSTGKLWLENTKGVVIELDAKRVGLALSLGADGVIIDLND